MKVFAERLPTLVRHLTVLMESWRRQSEADRAPKKRSDHEFLPAALEIIEKPPSPAMRALLLTLCGLFTFAILWALIGRIDIVAVASGKTIPAGNAKIIQPLQIGSVRVIHVRDGDFVRRGQLLVELDPTIASADEAQSGQALLTAQMVRARNDAILSYLAGRTPTFIAPDGTDSETRRTQEQMIKTSIASYESERASLTEQRAQRSAEHASAQAQIAKLRETMPFLDQQIEARRRLADQGYFSRLKLLEYEQARVEQIRDIDVQLAAAARARASVRDIEAQLNHLRETFAKTAVTELADASDKVGSATQEVRKAAKVAQLMQLRAPVDGVVQQLAIATVGGVVQPAQPLMVIVPCSNAQASAEACSSSVEVQAYVNNRDIGFIHDGQRVVIKLEAFNFTDYGFIEGRVRSVSRDSVDLGKINDDSSGRAKPRDSAPVYVARIDLNCGRSGESGLCRRVAAGMTVQAEILTGTRRIIDYLLSPLAKTVREAGRER